MRANPIPIIETLDGRRLTDEKGKPVKDAPTVEQLLLDQDPRKIPVEEQLAELHAVG
jgi:hypothetical protein